MPGFDGTGPRGFGPMTGGGGGLCILKLPGGPDEPLIGAAGRVGWPVHYIAEGHNELADLRAQVRQIESVLSAIRGRIQSLQAAGLQQSIGV